MKKENSSMLDKFMLYCLAIINPFLALIVAIIAGYGKNDDKFICRIKLISLYEMFDFFILSIAFIYGEINGLKISIICLLVFYLFVCAVAAYNKKDYISRGIALGLLTNHYCLAIMQTSEESNAKINDAKWPDSGMAMILMVIKILHILGIYLFVNKVFPKIIILLVNNNIPWRNW